MVGARSEPGLIEGLLAVLVFLLLLIVASALAFSKGVQSARPAPALEVLP